MNNYSEQKREVKRIFPEKLSFSTSKGKRKDQKRLYATTQRTKDNVFIKVALNPNDYFYIKEREAFESNQVKQNAPKLVKELPKGNVFQKIDGTTLDRCLINKGCSQKIILNTVMKMANFHKNSKKVISLTKDIQNLARKNKLNLREYTFGEMHGDLDPFNTMLSANKIYFIDWEDYRSDGICEIDFVHFLTMLWIILHKKQGASIGTKANRLIKDVFKSSKFDYLINAYCNITRSNKIKLINLVPVYCDLSVARLKKNKREWRSFVYAPLKKEVLKCIKRNTQEN